MRFHDPLWLYGLAAVPLLALISWWGVKRGAAAFDRFISSRIAPRLTPEGIDKRRKIRAAALMAAVVLLFVSIARPQYGVKPIQVKQSGIDLMILLDTSKSMAARDVKPSRIERARNETGRLISSLEGNRIGLIAFAGASFIECPLTFDISTVRMFLHTLKVGVIPSPGTAMDKAIYDAIKAFKTSKAKTKAVIMVTDGENLSGNVETAARAAKEAGLKIFPIGIGSVAGAPIPEFDKQGTITGYKKDEKGNPVVTRLDIETLRRIAELTGGEFYASQGESLDLSPLIDNLQSMEKTDITSFEFTEYEERYQPVALAALLLLLLEYALISRPGVSGPAKDAA